MTYLRTCAPADSGHQPCSLLPFGMLEHLLGRARHETVGCGLTETVDHLVHGIGSLFGSTSGEVLGDSIHMEPAAGPVRPSCVLPFRGMKQFHTTSITERRAEPACAKAESPSKPRTIPALPQPFCFAEPPAGIDVA